MKKIFSTIIFVMVAIVTWAYDIQDDGVYYNKMTSTSVTVTPESYFKYTLSNGEITLTGLNTTVSGALVTPDSMTVSGTRYPVTAIAGYSLNYKSTITSVILHEGLRVIGNEAFNEDNNIMEFYIPSTVDSINGNFSQHVGAMSSLQKFVVSENNKKYSSVDGVLYTKDMKSLIKYPAARKVSEYVIPEGVENIYSQAFRSGQVTNLVLPSTIKNVASLAFDSRNSLTNVTVKAIDPPAIKNYSSFNGASSYKLYVPSASLDLYKAHTAWGKFSSILAMPTTETWVWSNNCKSATLMIQNGTTGQCDTIVAVVTSSVKTAATCTTMGTTLYTAVATDSDTVYTATKELQNIPALGHDLSVVDNGDGTHTVTCSRCDYTVTEAHTFVGDTCSVCGNDRSEMDTNVSDYANILYTDTARSWRNGKVRIPIMMKNSVGMTGYQFDLKVWDLDIQSFEAYRDSTRKADNVAFSSRYLSDGSYRVLCYTTDGDTLSGNDGEVCTVTFTVPVKAGRSKYSLYLNNVVMTSGGDTYPLEKVKSTLVIGTLPGDANNDNCVNGDDLPYILRVILDKDVDDTVDALSADMNNDGNVDVRDVNCIIKRVIGTGMK